MAYRTTTEKDNPLKGLINHCGVATMIRKGKLYIKLPCGKPDEFATFREAAGQRGFKEGKECHHGGGHFFPKYYYKSLIS